MRHPVKVYQATLLLLAAPNFAAAAEAAAAMWGLCPHAAMQPSPSPSETARSAELSPTYLNSDYGEGRLDGIYNLRGDVSIARGPQHMEADRAVYDSQTGAVDAEGHVLFQQGDLISHGESAHVNIDSGTGEIDNADYQYLQQHAHGRADTIIRQSAGLTRLDHATYTTCDPGQEDWELRAGNVRIDQTEAEGEAYGVALRLKDVPVFYLPYINFPLDDQRKSGMLPPTIGYSNWSGFELGVPVYWNIAPNRDATITPVFISERGLLTKGEFRYLSERGQGEVQAGYLPSDSKFGADRGTLTALDQTQFNAHWSSNLIANYVSDNEYLTDFGNSLASASITDLDRRLDLNYNGNNTSFLARMQGYQSLDPTLPASLRPYQRLPQLVFTASNPEETSGSAYRFDGEYVRFERASSITGTRLNVTPSLAWTQESQSYFFIPKISVNHRQYQLDGQTPGQPANPSLTTPIYSLDSGLYLERDIRLGQQSLLQTLEPRLYYLRIPYRDQSALPLFDTGAYDFSFAQLFRENRFSGADRLGDTNQLSAAITTRLIDMDSGREWLSGSLGQIFYLADRQVVLGGPPETSGRSDLVAEGSSHLSDRWTTTADLQWNPDLHQADEASVQLRYFPDERHLINAGYRYRRTGSTQFYEGITQTDLSFVWLLTPRWQLLGRWNYSQYDHRVLEALAGVQYESCCWILRFLSRRYVTNLFGATNSSLFLQLELKGLGAIGNSTKEILENDILGYRPGM